MKPIQDAVLLICTFLAVSLYVTGQQPPQNVVTLAIDTTVCPAKCSARVLDLPQLSKRFFSQYEGQFGDAFDFLVFFADFPLTDANGFHKLVSNREVGQDYPTQGLGIANPLFNESDLFYPDGRKNGRLQSIVVMNFDNFRAGDIFQRDAQGFSVISVLAQEFGHRWLAFVNLPGEASDVLLGREKAHWSFFFDTSAAIYGGVTSSVMEGNVWSRRYRFLPKTYSAVQVGTDGYSPLDLYLMGLVPPDELGRRFFYIEHASASVYKKEDGPLPNAVVQGTARTFTFQDIIDANGNRRPNHFRSQKRFNVAFVFLEHTALPGPDRIAAIQKIDLIRKAWEIYFRDATFGIASMDTTLSKKATTLVQGYHDTLTCDRATGWAWDPKQPGTPVQLDVYDGPNKLAVVTANQFRSDLKDAGIGNGAHGFLYALPTGIRDGKRHEISVKFAGTSTNLTNSPKLLTCEQIPVYEGFHDFVDCNVTFGWTWDKNKPNEPLIVEIYDRGTRLGSIAADQFRQDLRDAGKGDGRHGFRFALPTSVKDGAEHSILIKIAGTRSALANSPKILNARACSSPDTDFSLAISPTTRTIRQGESTSHSVTIQGLNSFSGTVTLSVSGLPLNTAPGSGIFPSTVTLSPNTSGSATLSVFTTSSTQTGSFSVAVTATGAEKTRSATLSLTIEAATDPQKLPAAPVADPSLGNWTSSPQAITVTCGNAARVWYTVSTTTDGNTPADPPEPNSSLNNGQIVGAAGAFPVSASSGEYKKLKVRFRGENSSGYGPSSGPYFYSIDLRSSKAPVATFSITGDGKTATSPNELTVTVGPAGVLTMAFSASASYDPDGQITRYAWKNGSELISVDRDFTKPFGVGTYSISLTVTDNDGLAATTASLLRVLDRQVGQVHVRATLNGGNWEGPLSVNILGTAGTVGRSTVPTILADVPIGTYMVNYQEGGPENANFVSYSPAQSQILSAGQSLTFTLDFTSKPLSEFHLTATPQCSGTNSQILLVWTSSLGANAYTLHRSDGPPRAVAGNSFTVTDRSPGVSYTYFIRANDNYSNTKDSNTMTVKAEYCSVLNFDLFRPGTPWHTGKTFLYTSTIYGGKPPFNYVWGGEASGSGTWNLTSFNAPGPEISITYSTAGKKTVTLTMTDAAGRVEKTMTAEIDVVNPPPPTVTLHVVGTLNGQPWDGPASYKIVGRDTGYTFNGTKIDPAPNGSVFTGGPADQYSFTYLGGGPADGVSISPSATTLRAGEVGWFYIDFQKLLPDLEHYNFSDAGGGWDGPLIVSTEPGNHKLVREVPVNKDLYVDFALRNYPSNTATVPTSFTVDLLVDGTVVNAWTVDPLAPGKTFTANDYVIRFTTIGNHRVEFRIDPENRIQEKREDNNRWYVDLTVTETSSFVFQDDFNRTDLGPGWSVDTCVNGSVQIVSGRLKIFSKPAGGLVCDSKTVRAMVSGPVLTDVTTEFDFDGGPLTRSNNMTIVYARYVSPSSHYGVSIQRDELTDNPSRQSIVMYAPGRILAQALSTNLQPGRYQFSVVGNQMSFRNVGGTGTPINLTATDSAFTNGGVGFATNEAPEVYIDNVTVQGTKVQ